MRLFQLRRSVIVRPSCNVSRTGRNKEWRGSSKHLSKNRDWVAKGLRRCPCDKRDCRIEWNIAETILNSIKTGNWGLSCPSSNMAAVFHSLSVLTLVKLKYGIKVLLGAMESPAFLTMDFIYKSHSRSGVNVKPSSCSEPRSSLRVKPFVLTAKKIRLGLVGNNKTILQKGIHM